MKNKKDFSIKRFVLTILHNSKIDATKVLQNTMKPLLDI